MNSTTKHTWVARAIGPRYYRTFASYHVPYRPVDEKPYAETEGDAAYCFAYHDCSDRVLRFTNVRLVRPTKEYYEAPLSAPPLPGEVLYFAVRWGADTEPLVGERIPYTDTADRPAFWTGNVTSDGPSVRVRRVERRPSFTDVYIYWPDGQLRERVTNKPGHPIAFEFFDRAGHSLAERVPFEWPHSSDSGLRGLIDGRFARAREALEKGIELAEQEQSAIGAAECLYRLARVDLAEAKDSRPPHAESLFADASALASRALALWRALGDSHEELCTLTALGQAERGLARLARAEGTGATARHYAAAHRHFRAAVQTAAARAEWKGVAAAYGALLELAEEFDEPNDADAARAGRQLAERRLADLI